MDTRLEALAEFVLNGLVEKSLSDAAVYEFMEQSCSCIREEMEIQWDGSLGRLWEYVAGGTTVLEGVDPEGRIAFQQGKIYAILQLLRMLRQKQMDEETLEDDAKEYSGRWRQVFGVLESGESMTHRALASACGLSDSSLSQFLHRIEDKRYIQSRKVGRTKYYRLSSKGQRLLKCMPPQKEIPFHIKPHGIALKEKDYGPETPFENVVKSNFFSGLWKKTIVKDFYNSSVLYTEEENFVEAY